MGWTYIQTTTKNTQFFFINGNSPFGATDIQLFDSLWDTGTNGAQNVNAHGAIYTSSPPGWTGAPGITVDGNNFANTTGQANTDPGPGGSWTHYTVQAVTISNDDEFKPTAGYVGMQTIIGTVGNPNVADGSPLFPWDADGAAITSGAYVGAMQP